MAHAIEVQNLGKKYLLAHQAKERYDSLRDVLAAKARGALMRLSAGWQGAAGRATPDEFWALNDVSFTVDQGERVGIIGKNGAGKSTLLKILSRIAEPTAGRFAVRGRVASLLEVGTGFHPELTGRENIFLNGAILGMSRAEITRKFDEIVSFAEVERFLDTPVKRYSSGMYVRLAFAVAAHLEPEILIVDEVLAVGDAEFQKKCLGKMQDVGRQGRTVLFVSHNMAAVSNLCTSCLVLHAGAVSYAGATDMAIGRYLETARTGDGVLQDLQAYRPAWASPLICSARILDAGGAERSQFGLGSDLVVEMSFIARERPLKAPVMGVVLHHATAGAVGGVNTRMTNFQTERTGPYTEATMRCTLPRVALLPGSYSVELWLGDGPDDLDTLDRCMSFSVEETDIYGSGRPPFRNLGVVYFEPTWQIQHGSRLPVQEGRCVA